MKIISPLGIASDEMPTGNLVWVDSVNGNDSLAIRGRLKFPFKTLTAAKGAALSGDTIVVMPGIYNENNLVKNGVNWHFLTGAVVQYSGGGSAIFDTTGSAISFKVTGNGVFKTTSASPLVTAFYLPNLSDDLTLEFDRIEATGIGLHCTGGVRAFGNEIKSSGYYAVYLQGNAEKVVDVSRVESAGGAALHIECGTSTTPVRVRAAYITSSASYALLFKGGAGYVDALELNSLGWATVSYDCYGNHPLHLRVSRIINTNAASSSVALSINQGSGTNAGAIRLYGCALHSKYGTYSIASFAGVAKDVLCLQQSVIKRGASNVTARIHAFLDVTSDPAVGDL